jgi:hypothetical protein
VVPGTVEDMLGVIGSSFSFAIAKFGDRLSEAKTNAEHGFVLVYCSVTLVVLTALGGVGVDIGNWYWQVSKMQNAADSASLAGAIYLPGRPDLAKQAARESLKANGFGDAVEVGHKPTSGFDGSTDQATYFMQQDPRQPNQLHVAIGTTTSNFFISMLGLDKQNLVRSADGIYTGNVEMGSPGNVLGAEPLQSDQGSVMADPGTSAVNGKYWLNAAGENSNKVSGDRYMAGKCGTGPTPDECDGSVNAEVGEGTGGERANRYVLHIPKELEGVTVSLQAFDATYVNVGDHCESAPYGNGALGTTELRQEAISNGDDAGIYDRGAASPYCTGDLSQGVSGVSPELTFTVHKADGKLRKTGSALETIQYPSVPQNSGNPRQTLLNKINGDALFRESFRKWHTFATFSHAGDYIITATTTDGSAGANRYSLRAGIGPANSKLWNAAAAGKLRLYAQHHLTVYTNAKDDQTAFYFAKLTNQVAGRDITFELYDIGDVPSGQSVDMKFVRPTGVAAHNWIQSCVQNGAGETNKELMGCEIKGATTSRYNGKVVKITMKIPSTYSCNETTPSSCWMSLRFNLHHDDPSEAASPLRPSTDTTTWQINDCGSPLRLTSPTDEAGGSTFGNERECPVDLG